MSARRQANCPAITLVKGAREKGKPSPTPPKPSGLPSRDFTHPDEAPSADAMLDALSAAGWEGSGYGSIKLDAPAEFALRCETELYGAWVLLQCRIKGLRSPGQLSKDEYAERFWKQ